MSPYPFVEMTVSPDGDSFLSAVKEVDENTSKESLELRASYGRSRSKSASGTDISSRVYSNGSTEGPGPSPKDNTGNRRSSHQFSTARIIHSKLKYEISVTTDEHSVTTASLLSSSSSSQPFLERGVISSSNNGLSPRSVDSEGDACSPPALNDVNVRSPAALSPHSAISPLPPYSSPIIKQPPAITVNSADLKAELDVSEKKLDGLDSKLPRGNTKNSLSTKESDSKPPVTPTATPSTPSPAPLTTTAAAATSTSSQPRLSVDELFFAPIDELNPSFQTWTFIVNTLHAVHFILVPIQLAWTEYFINYGIVIAQLVANLIFLIDAMLLMRVIFKDEYGIICKDRARLRSKFLWKDFGIVRLLACLPLEVLAFIPGVPYGKYSQYKHWAFVVFIKMVLNTPYQRIYSIAIPGVAMPISRLIKTMLILMIMGHYDACIFWFIDQFLPPPKRWVDHFKLVPPISLPTCLRRSILSLVLHLREVELDAENVYVVFEFVFGILAYGTVFGNIHSIVEMLDNTAASNHAEEHHKFQMEWLKNYMREKRLVPEIQKMVTAHKELQWQKSKGMDESKMFEDLPRSVQQQIKNFMYLDLLKKVPIFQGCDINFQNLLCFKIRSVHVLDGWFIFRKGDEGDEMYFIKTGEVQICGEDGVVFVTLSTGSFFGEIALFEACKRTAAARAKGNVELCMLKKEDFVQIMDSYPHVAERIRETIRLRKEQEERIKAEKAREDARRDEDSKRRADRWIRRKGSRTSNTSGSRRSLDASHSVFNMISRNLSIRSKVNSRSQSMFGSTASVAAPSQHQQPTASESAFIAIAKSKSFARNSSGDRLHVIPNPMHSASSGGSGGNNTFGASGSHFPASSASGQSK
ncbi:hypothetical protein BC829DRAFT_415497 [Chytridium lagenaria]|nr:hypothetical protein BC829DRAFT_415497 [Chytridium lagenaria]